MIPGNAVVIKSILDLYKHKFTLDGPYTEFLNIFPDYKIMPGGIGSIYLMDDQWTNIIFGLDPYYVQTRELVEKVVIVSSMEEALKNGGMEEVLPVGFSFSYHDSIPTINSIKTN